jgi:hypothetical protein
MSNKSWVTGRGAFFPIFIIVPDGIDSECELEEREAVIDAWV